MAADCGQDPNLFEVTGDALDNRFDIHYLGPKGSATAACLTLFQSLYLGRGKYKEIQASKSYGVRTGLSDYEAMVYVVVLIWKFQTDLTGEQCPFDFSLDPSIQGI